MIKVAILSFWHVHADDYAKQVIGNNSTQLVAAWDELPERGKKEAEARGLIWYDSLDELLANPDIDAVVVNAPTNIHRDVMVAAANAGKHIFTEKVIAPTVHEVNEILAAVELNKVKLTISLPRLNDSYTLAIQKLLKEDVLGELTQTRVRLSHNGATAGWLPEHFYNLEQCGGGALIDLGCHPMYLTRLFLGLPESVSANYGYVLGKEVEDNAVAILRYANGALGIVEAGFVNDHSPFSIELHGKKGSLFYGTPENKMVYRSSLTPESAWIEVEMPAPVIPAFDQWVEHIENGTIATENIELALDLTKLMEASNLSVKLNRVVALNELI
ncbi:gfo/Idh/MocA family oxidoreductase [Paenibacillus psychroresistens]|uniref:Gfo/Idh/MocA family oxidoreductase n=1 Tax=Paenibacillus psychroresistens TaxID=1778678 RepID=A0A6B8RD72_9BACL|nr:Gfo/Idh/MocA family oxidoreductase [Paenibacillus psychroresistens]QGQ94391.1 gfo/Idh/MocA family oxidoreductase [Paenibacillus psychroresistens]